MHEVLSKVRGMSKKWARLGTGLLLGVSVLATNPVAANSEEIASCDRAETGGFINPGRLRTNVIYWDGWTKDSIWARNIQDPKWRDRWPYYTTINPVDGSGIILGDTQSVMDRDIKLWSEFGIDGISFVYYSPESPKFSIYNEGLNRFLASREAKSPTFSLILQGSHTLNQAGKGEFTDDILETIKNPKYQQVKEKQPLVYIYDISNLVKNFGSKDNTKKAIAGLREKSEQLQAGKLFIVGLDVDKDFADLGFDGFGSYAAIGTGEEKEYPYSDLMKANQAKWDELAAFGKEVILPVSIGWDPRPRFNHEEFGWMYRNRPWYQAPKPEQITQNIEASRDWMQNHPVCSRLRLVLIYSWDEYDEGLRLAPGLDDGTQRINAVKQAVTNSP